MNKIKIMHPQLANMIAAGEVVERPAGIIKELIENSLDANAQNIEVHIEEGGMGSIKVIDDGEGMSQEDLLNALKRHSTSKIFEAHDLNQIQTYGFRGEALPSIASVSTLIIQTNNGQNGHEIVIDNGTQKNLSVFARNKGTTVIVESLFTQVPARLKYIKNIRYEASIIVDIVQKFAISRPDVSFRLVDDEKEVYRSVGDNNFKNVYYSVFGQTLSEDAFSIEKENFDFKIKGMFSQPSHTRANRYHLWIYINDRMIRHPKIHNAIIEGFRRHIPKDRFPIGVLKIAVDPQLVDVNVHPSKWEIRLSKEEVLVSMIINALEESLDVKTQAPRIKLEDTQTSMMDELLESKPFTYTQEKPKMIEVEEEPVQKTFETFVEKTIAVPAEEHTQTTTVEAQIEEPVTEIEESIKENQSKDLQIEPLDVLAQMSGKYILAKGDKGLYIIDQHAAMERVRYEYYQNKLLNKESDTQGLLIPEVFDGRRSLVARETEVLENFKKFQITLEVFDEESFILREIPLWLKKDELREFVNKTLDYLENNRSIREEDFRQDTLATLACHSSVRFNEYMSHIEMETLVEQLRNAKQPFHCPHGRPTFMLLEEKEILKGFYR